MEILQNVNVKIDGFDGIIRAIDKKGELTFYTILDEQMY
jgi:hypothetical protein